MTEYKKRLGKNVCIKMLTKSSRMRENTFKLQKIKYGTFMQKQILKDWGIFFYE